MPSEAGDNWIDRASGMNPATATRQGISGAILAIFGVFIFLVEELGKGLANIIQAFDALRDFIVSFFTEPTVLLSQTSQFAADELTTGEWSFFGPFSLIVAVAIIATAWWVWNVLDPDVPFLNQLIPWR